MNSFGQILTASGILNLTMFSLSVWLGYKHKQLRFVFGQFLLFAVFLFLVVWLSDLLFSIADPKFGDWAFVLNWVIAGIAALPAHFAASAYQLWRLEHAFSIYLSHFVFSIHTVSFGYNPAYSLFKYFKPYKDFELGFFLLLNWILCFLLWLVIVTVIRHSKMREQ